MNSSLRLTPRSSPAPRTPTIRSPAKVARDEQQILQLRKVIGNTVTSCSAVSSIESERSVAYTAGGAVVVATIDEWHRPTQRIYRAKVVPNIVPGIPGALDSPTPAGYLSSQRSRLSVLPPALSPNAITFTDPFDSPNTRSSTAKARTKAITAVSLSPDGKWVAAGEYGHKPRVLIFSRSKSASSDVPVFALSEHAFGVKSVAFSPNSEYMASLGDINDGFLYVWRIDQKTGVPTLHASNKCTSDVKAMTWVGESLITVGTRHIKVWKINKSAQHSPSKRVSDVSFAHASPSKTLFGRNYILGPLLEKTYVAVMPLDTQRAIVCSDQGDICLLKDDGSSLEIAMKTNAGFSIICACIAGSDWLVVSGQEGIIKKFELLHLVGSEVNPSSIDADHVIQQSRNTRTAYAMAPIGDSMVLFDDAHSHAILDLSGKSVEGDCIKGSSMPFDGHRSAIKGLKPVALETNPTAAFLTFAADGSILLWKNNGEIDSHISVTINQSNQGDELPENELRVASVIQGKDSSSLLLGDRYGILRATNLITGAVDTEVSAHTDEITSIDHCRVGADTVIATGSRDRTIQVFRKKGHDFDHVQTLEDHLGSVVSLAFSSDSTLLISIGSDRSLIRRSLLKGQVDGWERIAYVSQRTVNLKSTPLSMSNIGNEHSDSFVLSTADKNVSIYGEDAHPTRAFKATDEDSGDAVPLNLVTHLFEAQKQTIIAGISNNDKSLRVYNESGGLLTRECGQTETVTGIAAVQSEHDREKQTLVTVASDGTIFMWSVHTASERRPSRTDLADVSQGTPKANAFFSTRPPLRRVLSSSELIKLQESHQECSDGKTYAGSRSPERKLARLDLEDTPELKPTPPPTDHRRSKRNGRSGSEAMRENTGTRARSPSPSSPLRQQQTHESLRRVQTKASQNSLASNRRRRSVSSTAVLGPTTSSTLNQNGTDLASSSQQLCRALGAYRRKLASSEDSLPVENVRDVERELSQTAKALAEKAARSEAVMEKLLDRYGERLVEIMERKIDEKVGRIVDQGWTRGQRKSLSDAPSQNLDQQEEVYETTEL